MCRSAAQVQNKPVPGRRGRAGEGCFAVPHCCRGTDPPPLLRAARWRSREVGGEGRGWASEERIEKSEELRCAALRHGFGKGCLGEAGGTNQKKAPLGGFFDPGRFRSAGTGAQIWGKEKSPERNSAPGPCLWQERSVSIANCMVSQKGRGRVWGNRRFLPHMERSGSPRRSGRHLAMPNALAPKEKGTFRCPFLLVRKMGLEPTHRSTGF